MEDYIGDFMYLGPSRTVKASFKYDPRRVEITTPGQYTYYIKSNYNYDGLTFYFGYKNDQYYLVRYSYDPTQKSYDYVDEHQCVKENHIYTCGAYKFEKLSTVARPFTFVGGSINSVVNFVESIDVIITDEKVAKFGYISFYNQKLGEIYYGLAQSSPNDMLYLVRYSDIGIVASVEPLTPQSTNKDGFFKYELKSAKVTLSVSQIDPSTASFYTRRDISGYFNIAYPAEVGLVEFVMDDSIKDGTSYCSKVDKYTLCINNKNEIQIKSDSSSPINCSVDGNLYTCSKQFTLLRLGIENYIGDFLNLGQNILASFSFDLDFSHSMTDKRYSYYIKSNYFNMGITFLFGYSKKGDNNYYLATYAYSEKGSGSKTVDKFVEERLCKRVGSVYYCGEYTLQKLNGVESPFTIASQDVPST